MTKLFLAMTAASAFAFAAPAAAQYGNQTNVNAQAGANIDMRIAQLETRLQAGLQSGAITQTEARSLRQQVRSLRQLERQYARNGLTVQERQDLQMRLRTLRQQFRMADGGGNGRWAENDDQDGYYGNGNGNGYAYGNGKVNDGTYGNGGYANGTGGPFEEVRGCQAGSGTSRSNGGVLGNVLGSILGGGNSNNCLEAGERASGNLTALPYELRNQFRDSNGIVYRTDGQRIYQIDVRTNTVLRVYAAPNY